METCMFVCFQVTIKGFHLECNIGTGSLVPGLSHSHKSWGDKPGDEANI